MYGIIEEFYLFSSCSLFVLYLFSICSLFVLYLSSTPWRGGAVQGQGRRGRGRCVRAIGKKGGTQCSKKVYCEKGVQQWEENGGHGIWPSRRANQPRN